MKNTVSNRIIILASPQGHLTMRRADHFRRYPDDHVRHWQRLLSFRLPRGMDVLQVRDRVYGWAIWTYGL